MPETIDHENHSTMAGSPVSVCSAFRIEQPYEIQPHDIWYFQTFIAHFGAVGGQRIPKAEVERRLETQAGPGQLVQVEGAWHWRPNDQAEPRRDSH